MASAWFILTNHVRNLSLRLCDVTVQCLYVPRHFNNDGDNLTVVGKDCRMSVASFLAVLSCSDVISCHSDVDHSCQRHK